MQIINPQHHHTKPSIPDNRTGVTTATIGSLSNVHVFISSSSNVAPRAEYARFSILCGKVKITSQEESWDLLEPAVVQQKGRPKGAPNKRKNHPPPWYASHFETTEQANSRNATVTLYINDRQSKDIPIESKWWVDISKSTGPTPRNKK
jgi:hypothetical protein